LAVSAEAALTHANKLFIAAIFEPLGSSPYNWENNKLAARRRRNDSTFQITQVGSKKAMDIEPAFLPE
jgi:hypothetical protein